jgi:hypothetical protein
MVPPAVPPGTWRLVTRYTAVESFHTGAPQAITGCPPGNDECTNGTTPLGSYPGDFLDAVRHEGTGRITSGRCNRQYLTWDSDSGYAVDSALRDAANQPLRAFASATADATIALGSGFRIQDCGADRTTGRRTDPGACARLEAANWVVGDGNGQPDGSRELDLYIGEEDRPGFDTASPLVIDTVAARTTLR